MSEERPQHPQQPAEGGDEEMEAPGAEQAGEKAGTAEDSGDEARPSRHTEEPAEGSEEDVSAGGAERAGGD